MPCSTDGATNATSAAFRFCLSEFPCHPVHSYIPSLITTLVFQQEKKLRKRSDMT